MTTATTPPQSPPIVLVPACNRQVGEHPFQVAGKKYIDFVRLAGCVPLVVPNAVATEWPALLALADGVLLTGAPSNVHPSHFNEGVLDPKLPLDPQRDAFTLPFIPRLLAQAVPLFAICRGAQEVNVALGGTLHQAVQDVQGLHDHRAPADASAEVQYGMAHELQVMPGGVLESIVGHGGFTVNSVHGQGIRRLAPALHVEALAPDGLVEAFSHTKGTGFNLCVQWHPEWRAADNAQSLLLAHAFGAACAAYKQRAAHRTLSQDAHD